MMLKLFRKRIDRCIVCTKSTVGKFINKKYDNFNFFWLIEFFLWPYI